MRQFSTALILGTALLFTASTASAKRGYDSTITHVPNQAIRIDVSLSDDLASRADASADGSKHCSIRRSSIRNGFAWGGYFGQRDLDALLEKIETHTTKSLSKKDISVSNEADLVLKLTLVDVQNNRPTQRQIGEQVTLSFQSFQLGGADFTGELLAADGTSLGTMSYSYHESFIDEFSQARGIWTDTNRAIEFFATRLAKDLAKQKGKGA